MEKSFAPTGTFTKTVDIVHDVINFIPVHWVATHIVRVLIIQLAGLIADARRTGWITTQND